jgi:two-component system phosphate regulon sensor histidine kinase PhoR
MKNEPSARRYGGPFKNFKKRFFERHDAVIEKKIRRELEVTLSHELPTPLTVIDGYSELLLENLEKSEHPQSRDNFDAALSIHDQSRKLLRFIDNTILLSTLEFNPQLFQSEEIDAGAIVGNTVQQWREFYSLPDSVVVSEDIQKDVVIPVNERLLRACAFELLANAYVYRKTDETSRIGIDMVSNFDNIRLNVSDNGMGIKDKHWDRVYEKFFRVEDRDTAETSGLGIGLTLVKRIVDFYGGSINFESVYKVGTTFRVVLPIRGPEK